MTDEKPIPPSKISYYHETEDLHKKECTTLSVESQTNEGVLDLFRKLREETK